MRLRGLHHVTAISSNLERTIAFYRDTLGLPIVHDGPSDHWPVSAVIRRVEPAASGQSSS